MNVTDIARVAHNTNKAFCESVGDMTQKSWEDAEQWQRDSAVTGVKFIINNPGASPSATHDSWLADKRKDGWKYGAVKDPIKKEHPCFVPYEQLPVEQKSKDYIFGAIVRSLITHIGEEKPELVDSTKLMAKTETVVDQTSFDQKVQENTTFRDDGRRVLDLGALTQSK